MKMMKREKNNKKREESCACSKKREKNDELQQRRRTAEMETQKRVETAIIAVEHARCCHALRVKKGSFAESDVLELVLYANERVMVIFLFAASSSRGVGERGPSTAAAAVYAISRSGRDARHGQSGEVPREVPGGTGRCQFTTRRKTKRTRLVWTRFSCATGSASHLCHKHDNFDKVVLVLVHHQHDEIKKRHPRARAMARAVLANKGKAILSGRIWRSFARWRSARNWTIHTRAIRTYWAILVENVDRIQNQRLDCTRLHWAALEMRSAYIYCKTKRKKKRSASKTLRDAR